MRIIARRTLREFWQRRPDARAALEAWHSEAEDADWRTPADIKRQYATASILKRGRVVFNVCRNRYRIVTWINYPYRVVYIRFIGTHQEYDQVDAQEI